MSKSNKPFYKKWWFILIAIIIIIGAVGSNGSKKADTTKETANTTDNKQEAKTEAVKEEPKKEEAKKEDTKVTYENFINIKMGQSYDEVKAILGEGKEISSSEVAEIKTVMYEWKGSGMGNMNITFQGGKVTIKAQAFLKNNDAKITMDLYNKIENGMTYDKVKSILGEGELSSETQIMDSNSKTYSYINKDGANANFTFTGDSMSMKAQFNLK